MIGVSILIVDDHRLFADAVGTALEQLGARIAGKVGSIAEAVAALSKESPDLVLLDLGLPDGGGVEAFRAIVDAQPGVAVIALTATTEPRVISEVIKAGFHGYVPKDAKIHAVAETIRGALEGRVVVIRPSRARAMTGERTQPAAPLTGRLTDRERQVLELIVSGAGSRAIAEELEISTNTVRTHVQSVLTKLQVHSRLEVAAFAVRNGLVDPAVVGGRMASKLGREPDAARGVGGLRRTGGVRA